MLFILIELSLQDFFAQNLTTAKVLEFFFLILHCYQRATTIDTILFTMTIIVKLSSNLPLLLQYQSYFLSPSLPPLFHEQQLLNDQWK